MRTLVRARKMRLAVTVALLAALASSAIILYSGAAGSATQAQGATEATPAESFQLLRDPPTATPPKELTVALTHAPAAFGLDLEGARQASENGVWLIPGTGEACLAVEDSEGLGMSCASVGQAEIGNLTFVERPTNGGPTTIVGAAPDGATTATAHDSDGNTIATTPVLENTYVVQGDGITGTTLSP